MITTPQDWYKDMSELLKKYECHFTNADRIRCMTDEELAEWFCTMCNFGDFCPYKDDCDTNGSGILKWLKEEVKE